MKLNNEDYKAIAKKFKQGQNNVEYTKNNEIISIEYILWSAGYVEGIDDYYNGSHKFIETLREWQFINAESWNEFGKTENDFDVNKLDYWVMHF